MKLKVRKINHSLCFVAFGFWLLISNPASSSFPASDWESLQGDSASPDNLRQSLRINIIWQSQGTRHKPSMLAERGMCSEQDIQILITQMLRDLPSYANRASQRGRRLSRTKDVYTYMLAAGRPEFEPLPLNPGADNPDTQKSAAQGVQQVFFTTLERQYTRGKAIELQQFHWLFLTKTKSGWQIVMMFSQTGSYPASKKPPSPPRDSTNGSIAQGINAWLRDCQAGSVRMRSAGV